MWLFELKGDDENWLLPFSSHWVHGNHLGVPLVTTNAQGQVVTPAHDFLRPGFPGQSQVLSDLYYNRARDYDPLTGRYIQADPIGLWGGSNPYLYAEADPVNGIDPLGLASAVATEPARSPRIPAIPRGLKPAAVGAGVAGGGFIILAPVADKVAGTLADANNRICWDPYQRWFRFSDIVLPMAKGGNQNKENEWSREAKRQQPNDPCGWLRNAYNDPTTSRADRQKIKTAQKALGCRRRG